MKDGGPAFPVPTVTGLPNGDCIYGEAGMSLRDYFAAKALQGMLASCPVVDRTTVKKKKWADVSYEFADAMLKAREAK